VLSFRLATTEVYFDKNQQKQERTEWHNVVLFGARAEPLEKLLSKGTRVLVEGRLQTSSYEKDGVKRFKTEVIASDLCLAGSRASNGAAERPARRPMIEEADVPF
jgi:single-strand DNA-binding protein